MANIRNIVLVDLDNTLSLDTNRRDLISKSWDAYHAACIDDGLASDVALILSALHERGYFLLAVTGRSEKWRALTNQWLLKHNVKIDEILMRPDDNFTKARQLKRELLVKRLGEDWHRRVVAGFEDNEEVGMMLTEFNVTLFQVFNRSYINDDAE